MRISPNSTRVLLIEDNDRHVEQITERLERAGFEVEHLSDWDEEELYNYKAQNPDSQIIITDLQLRMRAEPLETEALNLIRDHLWPVDRTTFFVVYSQFLPESQHRQRYPVEPYWTFVEKKVPAKEGPLEPDSLDELASVVSACYRYTIPALVSPSYDVYSYTQVITEYVRRFPYGDEQMEPVIASIERACERLEELTRAASYYSRAGRECVQISIGVYGSCGRMEMRDDSDLECSVFYTPGHGRADDRKKLAVAFWNRVTRFIDSAGWIYEGTELTDENESGLLLESQADDELKNGFQAVFNTGTVIAANQAPESRIRNRHLQILTELRAVFNLDHILRLKRNLLEAGIGHIPQSVRDIAESQYLQNLLNQFSMDAGPQRQQNWHDAKRAAYRVMNILALRLWLLGRVRYADRIEQPDELIDFLDHMCDAGIVKVCRFTLVFLDKASERDRGLMKQPLDALITEYCVLHRRLINEAPAFDGDLQQMSQGLRGAIRTTLEQFADVFDTLRNTESFSALARSLRWMFATGDFADLFKGQ